MFIVVFFSLTVGFAIILWIESDRYPECLSTKKDESYWQDSFALSWTTFSTVGYGHIYPALVEGNDQSSTCGWIISICAIEAFLGVLYAGLCAAILFAKIYRVQAMATVRFSKALTITYGGVHEAETKKKMRAEAVRTLSQTESELAPRVDGNPPQAVINDEEMNNSALIAFPVLSILMVNTLANKSSGGELVDAKISAVVTQTPDIKADESDVKKKGLFKRNKQVKKKNTLKAITAVSEYEHLSFVKDEHYLFSRVWVVDHVLDEKSPLLKQSVKEEIKLGMEQGKPSSWPERLNSAKGVRSALEPFENLVVSITAVSNSSACQVYGHEVYDYKSSIVVGYDHAEVAYLDSSTKTVGIDFEVVDDIVESGDGEGEDLSSVVMTT